MCGLFGFLNYSNNNIKNLSSLTKSLAEQSTIRGTDATGIAFNSNSGGIKILKDSKSAYKFDFKHPDNTVALIGHTRHSTSGFKGNHNNHPFFGKCKNAKFALAHNGVLYNDEELRKSLHLPKTKIETDSYIAVQLIESQRELSFKSIKYMAEKVQGSFSFSILDNKNNIYLVKGDSPLSVIHLPNYKMYIFASTDEILYKAIIDTALFSELKRGAFEEIEVEEGDILKLCPNGNIEKSHFNYSYFSGRNWWDYSCYYEYSAEGEYIEDLKSVANYLGYDSSTIDELLMQGYTPDEIGEYLYEF